MKRLLKRKGSRHIEPIHGMFMGSTCKGKALRRCNGREIDADFLFIRFCPSTFDSAKWKAGNGLVNLKGNIATMQKNKK